MATIETNSKVDIISKALILCGERPLVGENDNRYGATVGTNLFELLYENELQSNRWRFAMKKAALSRVVGAPLNEWAYIYQLPSDMLLPVGVYPVDLNYEIYADKMYSDRIAVELDYMFKPDITEAPAYFVTLLTYSMARDMLSPITESQAKVDRMEARYQIQRARAMYADAQGRPAKPAADSPFTNNRHP